MEAAAAGYGLPTRLVRSLANDLRRRSCAGAPAARLCRGHGDHFLTSGNLLVAHRVFDPRGSGPRCRSIDLSYHRAVAADQEHTRRAGVVLSISTERLDCYG